MNFNTILVATSIICAIQLISASNIRFINNIQDQSITIHTVEVGDITLDFQQVSPYTAVSGTTVTILGTVNVGGSASYSNTTIQVALVEYTTVVATFKSGDFYLVMFPETSSPSDDDSSSNQAWVRFIDLVEPISFVNIYSNFGSLFSYVGYLEATAFVGVDPSSTFTATQSGTSGTFPVTNSQLNEGSLYTIFLFTSMSGPQGIVHLDRTLQSAKSIPSTNSSTSSSDPESSSMTTTERLHYNSATKIGFFGIGSLAMLIIATF